MAEHAHPASSRTTEALHGAAIRVRWRRLVERHDRKGPLGALAMVNAIVAIGIVAIVAGATRQALVFPSLGPTVFLLIYRPHAIVSSPRNIVCGHVLGAASGLFALAVMGLVHQGASPHDMTAARMGAAMISLGLTTATMIWFDVPHPPAAATTLIIGLGFLDDPVGVGVLLIGVLLIAVQGFLVNRLAGIDYPLWRPRAHLPVETARIHRLERDRVPDAYPDLTPSMSYTIFVDATGGTPLSASAVRRLRAALGDCTSFVSRQHEWSACITVEAANALDAARIVRDRVRAAERAAGLTKWRFDFWEIPHANGYAGAGKRRLRPSRIELLERDTAHNHERR